MRYDLIMIDVILKSGISNIRPKNIVEIGSRDGHDVKTLSDLYSIKEDDCYIFEAHPDCYNQIKSTYSNYNTYNCAITCETGPITFNAGIIGQEGNIGMSSINKQVQSGFISKEVVVDGWRFDDACNHLKINSIDLCKIDVEGHSLEVLKSFGKMLDVTKIIQVELEHSQIWKDQATYDEVKQFLMDNNMVEVANIRHCWTQSDSLFINKNYINT
jgi:FkbM family methyltransferase